MKITTQEVRAVARLARLELGDAELETIGRDIDSILAYVDKLNEIDTDGIVPTAHAVPMENSFRDDLVRAAIGVEAALANAPERIADFYSVPKVIE